MRILHSIYVNANDGVRRRCPRYRRRTARAHLLDEHQRLLHIPHTGFLAHTWSLSVEEQFYIVWPVVLLLSVRWFGRRGLAVLLCLGVFCTVALREFVPILAYGVFRWDALLLGAGIAVFRLSIYRTLFYVGLTALLVASLWGGQISNGDYVLTAVAATLVVSGADKVTWLASGALVWLGRVSYSLYLWHVVVLRFGPPLIVSLPLSLGLAEVSFRLVERRYLSQRAKELMDVDRTLTA